MTAPVDTKALPEPARAQIRDDVFAAVQALMQLSVQFATKDERWAAARILADELLAHALGMCIATGHTESELRAAVDETCGAAREHGDLAADVPPEQNGPPEPDVVCLVTKDEHEAILAATRSNMLAGADGFHALMGATITLLGQETWDAFQGSVVGYHIVDEVRFPRVRRRSELKENP